MSARKRCGVSLSLPVVLAAALLSPGFATAAASPVAAFPTSVATELGYPAGTYPAATQPRGDLPVNYAGVIATLNREIPQLMREGHAVGLTITLVDGNRTVWTRGFGYADREAKRPVTTSTLFHIGSASKPITAAAIMQLVAQGRVNLDAPLTRYIPGFRMRSRYPNNIVTVRSIMTHHSGIPGDLTSLAEIATKPDTHLYAQTLAALRSQLPTRPVGEAWAYSNLAITLLQGVIENVSGLSFQQYTQRYLFAPMGMSASTFNDARPASSQLATNYQVLPGAGGSISVVRRQREYVNIWPAGSVVSNASDMANYLKTVIAMGKAPTGARILPSQTMSQMITDQKASPWDVSFFKQALVWWRGYTQLSLGTVVNHGGDTLMHHSMTAWNPSNRLGVFVSVNTTTSTSVTSPVWQRAMSLMTQAKTGHLPGPAPAPGRVVAPNRAQMAAMAGSYANSAGIVKVAVQGNKLAITGSAQWPTAVTRLYTLRSDGWYTCADTGVSYRAAVIKGQQVLIGRAVLGYSGLAAVRIPAGYTVPPEWAARVGTYRVTGAAPTNYPVTPGGDPTESELYLHDGLLLLDSQVLLPSSGQQAFTFGPTPMQVMRDAGYSVEAAGTNLKVRGVTLVPITTTASRSTPATSPQAWEQFANVFD